MNAFLPPELEREIFEKTALLYPKTIPGLLLVAHRVFTWIHPILYRTLLIKTSSPPLSAFMRIMRTMPANSSFFRNSVQNLFVHQTPWLAAELNLILASCPGITNFVMMSTNPSVLPWLENLRLERLAISLAQLFDNGCLLNNLTHPVFVHTTHLDLFDYVHNERARAWPTLALLPALTHLCLHSCVHRVQLRGVLAECTRLQVLVNMHTTPEREWELADICGKLAIDDPRFVLIALDISINAYARDWEAGRHGKKDFWALADAFVAKKRSGEIKPGSKFTLAVVYILGADYLKLAARCWICEHDGIY
ncbi:hypothetical protein C8R44DRAFT_978281 [Mycena epipterygia]|nr:hypothetical protein C8R44DRAFT_978281 [Mycena epipterygia]